MINPALQPMSTSELLDRTFHLYRNNFFLFAGIAALVPALALAAELLTIALGVPLDYQSYSAGIGRHTNGFVLLYVVEVLTFFLISLIATQFSYGATVYGVSMVHMDSRTTIRESYKRIRPFWGRLLGVSLLISLRIAGIGALVGISLVFGFFGFIIAPFIVWWGIYVYARCSLAGAVCVLEDTRAVESIERSHFLALNSTWRIFLILLLAGVLDAVLGYALGLPAKILKGAHLGLSDSMVIAVSQAGSFFSQTLTTPIATIALVLVYYDQRIRKEAFDLEVMMQALKSTGESRPAPAPM